MWESEVESLILVRESRTGMSAPLWGQVGKALGVGEFSERRGADREIGGPREMRDEELRFGSGVLVDGGARRPGAWLRGVGGWVWGRL